MVGAGWHRQGRWNFAIGLCVRSEGLCGAIATLCLQRGDIKKGVLRQQHSRFLTDTEKLLLFSYSFKWGTVHLIVHELSRILVSLYPETCFGVQDLAAISNSAISVAVTGRWICGHKFERNACSFQAVEKACPKPSGLTSDWAIRFGETAPVAATIRAVWKAYQRMSVESVTLTSGPLTLKIAPGLQLQS